MLLSRHTRRRTFLAGLVGSSVCPVIADSQSIDHIPHIGVMFLVPKDDPFGSQLRQALLQGLHEYGWNEHNLKLDIRYTGANDRALIQAVARELVAAQPNVIQVVNTPGTAAILAETQTIPVVFATVSDPIGAGFVETFSHPGRNATGFVNIESSMAGKWVQLLKEVVPTLSNVTLLFNPAIGPQAAYYREPVQVAANALSINAQPAPVSDVVGIDAAINTASRSPGAGLIVLPDTFMFVHREHIASLANRNDLPAIFPFPESASVGGLMAYGVDNLDLERRSAGYIDRILKGGKPADLPVQLPTKFNFIVNLKTAKSLGIDVPPMVLARADEVIE
jgi:putative ABC transport system substrate-binding protein